MMSSNPDPVDLFISILDELQPDLKVQVDAPLSPIGEWWIDVTFPNGEVWSVLWTSSRGFGLFEGDAGFFGGAPSSYEITSRAACEKFLELHAERL